MLRPTVKRGLMLDFIPDEIICPAHIDKNRVFQLNTKGIINGDIVYIMSRELRMEDNWAFIFTADLAEKHNRQLKIIVLLEPDSYSKHQLGFLTDGLSFLKENLIKNKINFEIREQMPTKKEEAGAYIVDFNPLKLRYNFANEVNCPVYEIDSHNIIPTRFTSKKQEYSAATLRRKVYSNIADFLTEISNPYKVSKNGAQIELENFIQNKLDYYSELKNDPNKNCTSNMSAYLHFGFISAQRIALEIIKSNAAKENKEAYLEELIVRKELSDNFCLYNQNYKSLKGIPNWAKESLEKHRKDIRTYIYTSEEFEYAKTHDKLWNVIQINLLKTGKIHGYLRMYWAKKILEWSKTPEDALKFAIYLNDKYAIDGIDPNGYVGILWSIGGIHDRPFTNRMITGKIRYMSINGCEKKFDVKEYIKKG